MSNDKNGGQQEGRTMRIAVICLYHHKAHWAYAAKLPQVLKVKDEEKRKSAKGRLISEFFVLVSKK